MSPAVGPHLQAFFLDGLITMKGLRPTSVRSYRDALRLFLRFIVQDAGRKITKLTLDDLSFERALHFLHHLEATRHNGIRTRNQRLACLHTFFEYLGGRVPEFLAVAERVAAIPMKRAALAETRFLERDEMRSSPPYPLTVDTPGGIAPSCCSSITPAPACRRPWISDGGISIWRGPVALASMARGTSGGRARSGRRPLSSSTVFARTLPDPRRQTILSSPHVTGSRSPGSVYTSSSAATRSSFVRAASGGTSVRTSFGTRPPSTCSNRASRSMSSAGGWAM